MLWIDVDSRSLQRLFSNILPGVLPTEHNYFPCATIYPYSNLHSGYFMSDYKPDPMFNDPPTEQSLKESVKILAMVISVLLAVAGLFYVFG